MPRFKCESCEATLYSAARPTNLIDPSCPSCGAPFEEQRELELVAVAPLAAARGEAQA